jgi:hypothetical protein
MRVILLLSGSFGGNYTELFSKTQLIFKKNRQKNDIYWFHLKGTQTLCLIRHLRVSGVLFAKRIYFFRLLGAFQVEALYISISYGDDMAACLAIGLVTLF